MFFPNISKQIKLVLSKYSDKWINSDVQQLDIRQIDFGESHVIFKVTINKEILLIFRICYLGIKQKVLDESRVLKMLPEGIGPKVLLTDVSEKYISYPYMVQSFVDGRYIMNWDINKLKKLSDLMFRYHQIKSPVPTIRKQVLNHLNCENILNHDTHFFYQDAVDLQSDNELKKLRTLCKKYFKKNRHLVSGIQEFSLVHGDLASINILYNDDDFNIIDWEYAHYNDPARDFASFFYPDCDFNNSLWRVQLDKERRNAFIQNYSEQAQDPNIDERVSLWIIYEKIFSIIFLKWRINRFYFLPKIMQNLNRDFLSQELEKLTVSLNNSIG